MTYKILHIVGKRNRKTLNHHMYLIIKLYILIVFNKTLKINIINFSKPEEYLSLSIYIECTCSIG